MVELLSAHESYTKFLLNRYGLKTRLKILCFIKDREIHDLKTNGAIIIRALNMNDKAYTNIATLQEDGMITRDKKKFITVTKRGDNVIRRSFFQIIPDYETNCLLKNFVQYLSSETKQFLTLWRKEGNFVPDKFITLLNEELLEFYEVRFKNFCRNIEAFRNEVN